MSAAKDYTLTASGCDDETEAKVTLTDEERVILERVISALNEESSYGCQPTLKLSEGYTSPKEWHEL